MRRPTTFFLLSALALYLANQAAAETARQFFTDGNTIGGWARYPEYGLDEAYHFAKVNAGDTFYRQEIAVRYYNRPGKIFFYDHLVTRRFKGFYDENEGTYHRLPDQFRRGRLEEIRPEWFVELKQLPALHDMFKSPCEPFAPPGAEQLADPPPTLPLPPGYDPRLGKVVAARTWRDSTGRYSVQADFESLSGGQVVLRKRDGSKVRVQIERLSSADREFAQSSALANPRSVASSLPALTNR